MGKSLIAYYSRNGNNYVDGKIVNLLVGNTALVAQKLQKLTGADLFNIETVKHYPDDYTEATEVARGELRSHSRPEITGIPDLSEYDTIFLGYPNWWGTIPMAVFTFLESLDFKGKKIIPFCTHEGSGLGKSVQDIRKYCSGALVDEGIAIRGGSVAKADNAIDSWLRRLNKI